METKKPKATAPTDEELSQMLDELEEEAISVPNKGVSKVTKTATPQAEQDILAELENLGAQLPSSRPHTPRVTYSVKNTASPATASLKASADKAPAQRKSEESSGSIHPSFIPSTSINEAKDLGKTDIVPKVNEPAPSGGWWGSVFATATAAVKTAEAAVKEIQQNEEAKRWADQVRDNVGALRGLGGQISSRALPSFTSILHTLAPPISSHERLQIHITHDLIGYPSLEPLIYSTFSRVMAQVEGGDLLVIQRGQEFAARRTSETGNNINSTGWSEGPWWRQKLDKRDLAAVKGLVEGTKLVRASAEAYAEEYFNSHGGIEKAAQRATEDLSESNPVRSSDIFLALQAVAYDARGDLFQGSTKKEDGSVIDSDKENAEELVLFAIYLHDPVHCITFHTVSQSLPAEWVKWLDAPSCAQNASPATTQSKSGFFGSELLESQDGLPEEIAQIIGSGGVDPREWVSEWIEEIISLATGILAQRYVARRMGVRERGIAKGKGKAKMDDMPGEREKEAVKSSLD
ncbi:hypothetical protein K3495_g9774 [Podosphaera aphanis]|nr:hypothetical protein K3495_g9774 [Podosphaera aphanis]